MSGYANYEINKLREMKIGKEKQPFPHQLEAFGALAHTLPLPISGYKGTMLVLPTGGGKTFTAVNWICRNILSKGIKVLWLAQSSYLLDQAAQTFSSEIHSITGRESINLRVVSSSQQHSNAGSILPTDDVVICITQTAIRAYFTEAEDAKGNIRKTPLRQYIDQFSESELFEVVDEAHHTPAFGCRTLLVSLKQNMKNLYVLGLTATPYHNDKRISGWLKKIYDQDICYQADINVLQTNSILSVPKYIEKQTGIEFGVDDQLFERLTKKHKDLPEEIIEKLANDSVRNNYIVSDYVNNREQYGKTIIFTDRWYQCEYIVEKITSQGIKANAVYSKIENSSTFFTDGSGRRSNKDNEVIMEDFRQGNYDVIVNVKMLTEGVDVPEVKTVMITRQTTSPILYTQMIGRALRGKKAGGGLDKAYANIVFFMDRWKRPLPFIEAGDTQNPQSERHGRNPFEIISIQLVKNASRDIDFHNFETPYLSFIPVGWYATDFTVSIEENGAEEFVSCLESAVAYDFNQQKYENLIDLLLKEDLQNYANEKLNDEQLLSFVSTFVHEIFDEQEDNIDGTLYPNVINIIRHIVQNGTKPEFVNFNERNHYDLDKIAEKLIDTPPRDAQIHLKNLFNHEGRLWKILYGDFQYFKRAFDHAVNRVLNGIGGDEANPGADTEKPMPGIVLTDEIKKQVLIRDHYQCLCCDKERRRGVSLEIDHILPVSMGGTNAPSNLQTLCRQCNSIKGVNEINYQSYVSPLNRPKNLLLFYAVDSDTVDNIISRIVNHVYHCKALSSVHYSVRKNGKYYDTWEINLFHGNNPSWLENYSSEILNYVQNTLGWDNVKKILIKC